MLSAILLDNEPHPTTFAHLNDVAGFKRGVTSRNLTVDPHSALFDEASRLAIRSRQAAPYHSLDQPQREPGLVIRNLVGHLAAAEATVEVRLGPLHGVLAVEPPDEGAG